MPLLFQQRHLRVETPQTTDGKNLAYNDDSTVIIKTSVAPVTARRALEALNAKLPTHLRSKITEVAAIAEPPSSKPIKK
jgi:hypothetical protein